jgi:hypothetical protein
MSHSIACRADCCASPWNKAKSGERIFRHIDIKELMDGETTNSDAACVDKHIGSDVNDLELQLYRGTRRLPLRHYTESRMGTILPSQHQHQYDEGLEHYQAHSLLSIPALAKAAPHRARSTRSSGWSIQHQPPHDQTTREYEQQISKSRQDNTS